ncbi:hypothetical protein GCM10009765_36500 [Fodinicola feengrottensis]|uniref:Uncharacterized protein n=1 Tax=Fodinicola feengrottensis TaxID=435914 RepID=A0ABN2H8X7_9ACTN
MAVYRQPQDRLALDAGRPAVDNGLANYRYEDGPGPLVTVNLRLLAAKNWRPPQSDGCCTNGPTTSHTAKMPSVNHPTPRLKYPLTHYRLGSSVSLLNLALFVGGSRVQVC